MTKIYTSFAEIDQVSKSFNERNDCAVKAVAIATGITYGTAHEALRLQGRVNRRGTYEGQYHNAIKMLGFKIFKVDVTSSTMRTVERELRSRFPGRKFVILVDRHVAAFNGESVIDWSQGGLRRVKSVHEVIPRNESLPEIKPAPKPLPEIRPTNLPKQAKIIIDALKKHGGDRYTRTAAADLAVANGLKTKQDPVRIVMYYKKQIEAAGFKIV